jgi:protein SCO1/2
MRPASLLLSLFSVTLSGCGQSAPTETTDYPIRGKVTAVDASAKKVTINHEDIPGLMKAMEMPFAVESEAILAGVKPGDRVKGRLAVESGGYVIKSLKPEPPESKK